MKAYLHSNGGSIAPYFTCALVGILSACGAQSNSTTTTSANSDVDPSTIATECLNAHNQVRSAVTAPANYPGTWTQLPPLAWSATVAASATAWANHLRDALNCRSEHDTATVLGENISWGSIGYSNVDAISEWAAEAYDFDPSYKFNQAWEHYTQIVWRATTELGCGVASCSNGYHVLVCRYSPAGNVLEQQPY